MIMKANKQIGFININEESIDKILKDGEVVFERGFLREKTSTTLPITFGGVGKDLKDYRVYGNTYQNSTIGKNLINLPDGTYSNNGLTANVNNGQITLNGTPTATTFLAIPINLTIESNTNYVLSANNEEIIGTGDQVQARFMGDISTSALLSEKNATKLINKSGQTNYTNFTVRSSSGITFNNFIIKPQLEIGSNSTSYEPYTGGEPSPNPDYPQKMVSCGDLITDTTDVNYGKYKIPVNVRSDNLCNITSLTGYQYNSQIPTTPNNNFVINNFDSNNLSYSITSNGYVLGLSNVIKLEPNTIYTMSCIRNSTENSPRIYIYNYVNNTYTLNSRILEQGNLTLDFTTDETGNIVLGFAVGNNSNSASGIISNIQLIKGSTTPSKYIPYYNETTNIYLDEPLRKTKDGTYVDYIDFINQKVYRQLGGAEISDYSSFGVNTIAARFIQYLTPVIENLKLNIRDGISFEESYFFCNYIRMFGGSTATSKIRINIPHEYLGTTSSSTSSEAKQALINLMSGKTMEFVYPLETPTEEDIELPNIPTLDGNNTLNIETEITPSQVYIKYKSNE